jgi:predicted dehydrogenase
VKDAQAMISACKAANVKLFIAYRCQYESSNRRAIEMIRSGAIGKIQSIVSTNGFNIHPGEWRLDKKLSGGGPLLDVGIYSLNACRYLTGEEPGDIHATASVVDDDGRFETVEENVSWTMKFPSGAIAACATTYGANMPGSFQVFGSKGSISADPAFAYEGIHMTAHIQGSEPIEWSEEEKDPAQFAVEGDEFSKCILENREPKTNGEEGLRDMQYIAQIYKAAGMKIS